MIKRYKLPVAMFSDVVRAQAEQYSRDPSTGLAFKGPCIEQDMQFGPDADQTVIDEMHARMLAAGWVFVSDDPAGQAGLIVHDNTGAERRVTIAGDALDVGRRS